MKPAAVVAKGGHTRHAKVRRVADFDRASSVECVQPFDDLALPKRNSNREAQTVTS